MSRPVKLSQVKTNWQLEEFKKGIPCASDMTWYNVEDIDFLPKKEGGFNWRVKPECQKVESVNDADMSPDRRELYIGFREAEHAFRCDKIEKL